MTDTEAAKRTLAMSWAVHEIGDPYEKKDMGTDEEIEQLMKYWENEVACLEAYPLYPLHLHVRHYDYDQEQHCEYQQAEGEAYISHNHQLFSMLVQQSFFRLALHQLQ